MLQKTRLICKGWCGWNVKTKICSIQCLETIWITLVGTVGIIWDPIECFEQMICSCVRFSVRPCCLKRICLWMYVYRHQHVEVIQVPFRPFRHYYIHKHIHRHHMQVGWIGGAWWPGGGKKPQQWWLFSLFAKQRGKESQDKHIYRRKKKDWSPKSCFFFLWVFFFSIVRTSFLKHLVMSWHVVCRLSSKRYVHPLFVLRASGLEVGT